MRAGKVKGEQCTKEVQVLAQGVSTGTSQNTATEHPVYNTVSFFWSFTAGKALLETI